MVATDAGRVVRLMADWNALRGEFGVDLADWCKTTLCKPGRVELTSTLVRDFVDCDDATAQQLLELLADAGEVTTEIRHSCSCCGADVPAVSATDDLCPHCGEAYVDCQLRTTTVYVRENTPGRSVPWVLVLHGMKTRGAWQERFAWLAATTYIRAVPVFVYKYGVVRVGVLFKSQQRRRVRELDTRINSLTNAYAERLGSRPDVIAHSFGTWLLAHALIANPNLAVGRVVLTGSIVRPDFDWQSLVERGQVEAVLDHYSPRDRTVPLAQLFIWDSGPSGNRGTTPGENVVNHRSDGLGHSDYFADGVLEQEYDEVWRPFLTRGLSDLASTATGDPPPWRPLPWPLRAVIPRFGAIMLIAAAIALCAAVVVLGAADLVR